MTKNPGVGIKSVSGGARRFRDSKRESYSAKSGIDFILGSKVNTGYSKSIQTSSTQQTINKSMSFPSVDVSFGRLERYRIIGWLFKSFSVNTSYGRKTDQTINKNTNAKEKENVTNAFSPLVGVSFTWLGSVQTQGRYEYTKSSAKVLTGGNVREQRSFNKNFTLSTKYSFRSPTGFKIPILGRIKFQSTLTLSVDISKRMSKSETVGTKGEITPGNERTDFSVSPRVSYGFSANINGGLSARWQDTNDRRTGRKSNVRQLGIWTEIRF